MDKAVQKHYDNWYPQIKECSADDPSKPMLKEISQYRKTSQFNDGKTAILGLRSRVFQNYMLVTKVEEFILCISAIKITNFTPKMHEKEVETAKRMHEIKTEFENNRGTHCKNLLREMNAINTETRDTSIMKRVTKCHEFLKSIHECKC